MKTVSCRFWSLGFSLLLPQIESVCFFHQQCEPVQLWGQDGQVAHVAVQRQMEGNALEGDAELAPVHPVHVREEQDPAGEETGENHETVDPVEFAVLKAQLEIRVNLQ